MKQDRRPKSEVRSTANPGGLSCFVFCISCFVFTAPLFAAPSPADTQRIYLRGLLQERSGRAEEALAEYERVVALDPEATFVHEAMASLALRLGQLDYALSEAETVVRLLPRDPHSFLVLGRVRLARGEVESAEEAFDKALALDPNHNEALLYAAHLSVTTQPQRALGLYDRFLQNNPDSLEARMRMAELHQRLGNLEAAEQAWKKALEMDPSDFSAHLALAHVYEVRRDTAAAIAEYEACRFLDPQNMGVLMRLGELHHRFGDDVQARQAFRQALELEPEDPTAHFWLALLAEDRKEWGEAARRMEAVARQSRGPDVLLRLAFYYSQEGRGRQAVETLKRLHRQDPDNPDFLYYVALAYEDLGKPRTAIRWLNRALKRDPDRALVHFHLGMDWDQLKKFSRAETHLIRAVELSPDNAVALNYLGYSWADRGENLAQALEYIQRAVALEPDNGAFLDSLGWVYFKLGRLREAETALGRAVRLLEDPVLWEHYGDVLAKLGKAEEAARAWQEGLLLDPHRPGLLQRMEGQSASVRPLTAARTLLKRVEGNFRQMRSLTAFVQAEGEAPGRLFQAKGALYYARPRLFRFEFLGPFFVPHSLLIQNSGGLHWRSAQGDGRSSPEGRPSEPPLGPTDGAEERWLLLFGDVLSGDLVRRFDAPEVQVKQKGSLLIYTAPFGEMEIDARDKALVRLLWNAEGASRPALEFLFRAHRQVEGLLLPAEVEGRSLDKTWRLSLSLKGFKVNPPLDARLFEPPVPLRGK